MVESEVEKQWPTSRVLVFHATGACRQRSAHRRCRRAAIEEELATTTISLQPSPRLMPEVDPAGALPLTHARIAFATRDTKA